MDGKYGVPMNSLEYSGLKKQESNCTKCKYAKWYKDSEVWIYCLATKRNYQIGERGKCRFYAKGMPKGKKKNSLLQ